MSNRQDGIEATAAAIHDKIAAWTEMLNTSRQEMQASQQQVLVREQEVLKLEGAIIAAREILAMYSLQTETEGDDGSELDLD